MTEMVIIVKNKSFAIYGFPSAKNEKKIWRWANISAAGSVLQEKMILTEALEILACVAQLQPFSCRLNQLFWVKEMKELINMSRDVTSACVRLIAS